MVKNIDKIISQLSQYRYNKHIKIRCNGFCSKYFKINPSWDIPDFNNYRGYRLSPSTVRGSHICIHVHDERFTSFYGYLDETPIQVKDVLSALDKVYEPLCDVRLFHFTSQNEYGYGNKYSDTDVDITDLITISEEIDAVIIDIKTEPFLIDNNGFHFINEKPVKDVFAQPEDKEGDNYIVYGPVLNENNEKVLYVDSVSCGAGWMKFMEPDKLKKYFKRQTYKKRVQVGDNLWEYGNFDKVNVKKWKYIKTDETSI